MASTVLLMAILSLALFAFSCRADLIGDVCSQTVNPNTCNKALRSDPKYAKLGLRGLGQVALNKSRSATILALHVVKSLRGGGAPKPIVETCTETFSDALDSLDECRMLLKSSVRAAVETLQTIGSAALTDFSTCDDEFGAREPAKLRVASRRAQDLISVLLAIANRL